MARKDVPAIAGRRQLGATLARLRRQARRTLEEAAGHLDWPVEMADRVENGQAALRMAEARALLDLYAIADPLREEVLALVRQAGSGTWWLSYGDLVDPGFERQLILEDEARTIRVHQPNLVPGLLQTERYAWELMTTVTDQQPEAVRRRVDLRILRQRILGRPQAPRVDVVLDEAALRRPVGDAAVMREQYERLMRLSAAAGTRIAILPFPAGPSRASGHGFHIFSPRNGEPDVVQLELLDREYFTETAEEVGHYRAAFEHARARAMGVGDSRAFLAALAASAGTAGEGNGGERLPRTHPA
ncbi:hypothetical protein ABH926_009342 [Catenulispora sp. GP43]|uniref:DUF5753 domain-containing protein n=1 Tax=Catenulispora sp. GP43 TaxID=3156263 RepID=UPI003517FA97